MGVGRNWVLVVFSIIAFFTASCRMSGEPDFGKAPSNKLTVAGDETSRVREGLPVPVAASTPVATPASNPPVEGRGEIVLLDRCDSAALRVLVNDGDRSSKEDLISVLHVLASYDDFTVKLRTPSAGSVQPEMTLSFTGFDHWTDVQTKLLEIAGVRVSCETEQQPGQCQQDQGKQDQGSGDGGVGVGN